MPNLSQRLEELRQDLINGKGFFRFRGLPVQEWDLQKCATAYMGLGTYLGYFLSQNGRGTKRYRGQASNPNFGGDVDAWIPDSVPLYTPLYN